jgi:hypothetical protein
MPYKTGKLKGELTAAEIRKLVRGHNKLVNIKIPSGLDRDGLIKFLKSRNFDIDHKKQRLIDKAPKRGKSISLDTAKAITKRKPKEQAKQTEKKPEKKKVEAIKAIKGKKKSINLEATDKEEKPKQRRKLKGRLTKVRDEETRRIEKEIPEFFAPDKEDDNRAQKIKNDIILSYRKIKASGDKELLSKARDILDQAKGRKRVERDITYMNDLRQFLENMKAIEKKIGEKKEPEKKEPEKKETKKKEDIYETKIIPEVKKEVIPIFNDWLKNKDKQLYKEIKSFKKWKVEPKKDEETGTIIKKGVKNPRPKYYKEKEKMIKDAKRKFAEIHKKYNFSVDHRGFENLKDGILQGRGDKQYDIKPNEEMRKLFFQRRKDEREQTKKENEKKE